MGFSRFWWVFGSGVLAEWRGREGLAGHATHPEPVVAKTAIVGRIKTATRDEEVVRIASTTDRRRPIAAEVATTVKRAVADVACAH